jgi:hypothetical protein
MNINAMTDRVVGVALLATTVLVIFNEWGIADAATPFKPALVVVLVAILAFKVRASRKAFILVAIVLSGVLALTGDAWGATVISGLNTAAFIGAFFTALSTLRTVAQTSPAIQRAGTFLAGQPPGRRYGALTVGGQAFSLLLSYGSLQLLGGLALANANAEPDAEIRRHRTRRMLLAIQRAFVSTLAWSPLSFAVAISTTVIPGTSWAQVVLPGLVTSFILAGIGWALDVAIKPKLRTTPQRTEVQGTWAAMLPLAALLGLLVIGVSVLYTLSGVRIIGIVAALVPAIAVGWLLLQNRTEAPFSNTLRRIGSYARDELPGYRGELVLLMMAGYIGTVGSQLLVPLLAGAGVDLSAVPPWVILVSFVWIIPLAGQFGMNPILAVTLLAPLIPGATDLGVEPTALVVALTCGWSLSGITSPFTATTLIIGSFGKVSASHVGLVWNGLYAPLCAVALTVWVLIYAFVI